MANINDVAKLAGVSPSTVSRVLNASAPISESTRKRVLDAVDQLKYRRRISSAAPHSVNQRVAGVIIPDLASEYYTSLAQALCARFQQKGYLVQLYATDFDPDTTVRAVEYMASIHVSCMLVIIDGYETVSSRLLRAVQHAMIPAMFITAQYDEGIDADCLYVDERRGGAMVAEHLVHRGYRRIGFIGETKSNLRYQYFEAALRNYGLRMEPRFTRIGEERGELGGYLRMKELLALPELPDAVYAGYDQIAFGALHALTESGLQVPKDIALIGFDNVPSASYIAGGLSTIGHPFEEMAAIAVRILIHRISAPYGQTQQIALKPMLLARATT